MSNVKPLIALGLTAAGTALVANFQVAEPTPITVAAAPTTSSASGSTTGAAATSTHATTATTGTASATVATPTPTQATTSTGSTGTATTAATSSGAYADGTYTGAAVNEPWGTFEVQVTVSGGEITAVNLVSAPTDRHSSSINSYAVPQLTEEALAAQSSEIDMVSGATWTSQSYVTSLQAALDDAAASTARSAG